MHIARLTFGTCPDLSSEPSTFQDDVEWYVGRLVQNGQVYWPYLLGYEGTDFVLTAYVPEIDAFCEDQHSHAGREARNRVIAVSGQTPALSVSSTTTGLGTSDWRHESALCVAVHVHEPGSPVCGGCERGQVPLYRLPLTEVTRSRLYTWDQSYRAYYDVYLNSRVLAEDAGRQLSLLQSDLVVEGREYAALIEEATRLPTYYELVDYSEAPSRSRAPYPQCPSCGDPWSDVGDPASPISGSSGVCQRCRLIL